MVSVVTATYNRAHTLKRLFVSLKRQNCKDFEWIVIDDGSTDCTPLLFSEWSNTPSDFDIRYYRTENNGKMRAINMALELASHEYFFIVDSDDALCDNAISFIHNAFKSLPNNDYFIGISGLRGFANAESMLRQPVIDPHIGYVDASNIEREKYGLQADMAEAFFTKKLRNYKFSVWHNEKFTPEAVIWDKIALDGYKLRWYNQIIYICEYQADGLSNSSWILLKNNPMGYAMFFNTQLLYKQGFTKRTNIIIQFISCCCLAKEYGYINKCNTSRIASFLLFPFGWLLSLRRKTQFKRYIK